MEKRKLRGPYRDITNKKYGHLLVTKMVPAGDKGWMAVCKCEFCGKEITRRPSYVKSGEAKCPCQQHEYQKYNQCLEKNIRFKGFKEMGSRFCSNAKRRAQKNNWDFNLTSKFLYQLFEKQNKKCALSGLDIKFSLNNERSKGTASLDRIDSSKGYVRDNVQWVHKDVNKMKNVFSNEYLIELCKNIHEFNKKAK